MSARTFRAVFRTTAKANTFNVSLSLLILSFYSAFVATSAAYKRPKAPHKQTSSSAVQVVNLFGRSSRSFVFVRLLTYLCRNLETQQRNAPYNKTITQRQTRIQPETVR